MSGWVTLPLAHPLTADQAARLRARDVHDYGINEEITVPREEALAVINAGYASGVDPADREAVAKAMKEPELAEVPAGAEAAEASGSGSKKK